MNKLLIKNPVLAVVMLMALSLSVIIPAKGREAGEPGKIALKVNELVQSNVNFHQTNLFLPAPSQFNKQVSNTIKKYTLLQINSSALKGLLQSQPEFIRVSIPGVGLSTGFQVLLYKVNISANGFTLETSDGRKYSELNPIVHYRGMIENDMNSVVSFSFSEEETMGILSNDAGNYVLGEREETNANEYVFYNDKDLIPAFTYECSANTSNLANAYPIPQNNNTPGVLTTNCVDWFYEIDYDIYVGKGSDIAVVNSYIQGVFNQVSTLYNNDGVSITLQTLFVWTSTDPYTGPSTSNYLNQFGAYRTSFAGDLANLVGYAGGGGIAYVNGLCGATQYKMGYMGISSSYNTVPTYSWTAEVVTHEDGHLLGSRHTHDCVWNGNSTAIDGCGDAAGYNGSGSCATGPLPTSGTIMSYCHLVSGVGINFNNGFGSQPLAVILNNVNNASCLAVCSGCQPPPQPGTISGITSYCIPSSQTYSVTAVAGATSYLWTLPSGWTGTSTTNSITVSQTSTGGTVSVIAINSCGNSPAKTLAVTSNAIPSQPGNLIGSTSVCQGSSQTYSIGAVSGATSYVWTLPVGWTGTSTGISITATAGATGGTVAVAAVNNCGTGTTRTVTVSINALPAQPGTISGTTTVCPSTSTVYSVSSVPGATSYTWTKPSGWSGTSTTNSITLVSGTAGGTISVTANNACGSGTARTATISMSTLPLQPGAVSSPGGIGKVCPGSVINYSITAVSGATSYNWTPPVGSTVTNGQGTNSVTVTYNAGFVAADTIKVVAINACGPGPVRKRKIDRNTPAKPATISGAANNVCNGNNIPYTVTNVAGITYNWSFSTGSASVQNGQGTNSIAAAFTPNYLTGTLSVTASNACGISAARTLTVAATPAQPSPLTGTLTPCSGQVGVPYSTTPVAGAVNYTWNVPSGGRINDGTTTSTTATMITTATAVTVNFAATAGYVRVKANNACGSGVYRSVTVAFSCRLSADETSETFDAVIFPNPANEEIHVQYESVTESNQQIRVTDLSGKTQMLIKGTSVEGTNEIDIDIRQLSPGIYFLELINGTDRSISKISVE